MPALGCFLGIPFFLVTLYSSNFYKALLFGLFGEYLVAECWFGPYMAALQVSPTPPHTHAPKPKAKTSLTDPPFEDK